MTNENEDELFELSSNQEALAELSFQFNELTDEELEGVTSAYLHIHTSMGILRRKLHANGTTLSDDAIMIFESINTAVTTYYNIAYAHAQMRKIG